MYTDVCLFIDGQWCAGASGSTEPIVNPAWRKLDVDARKARQAEQRLQAKVAMSSVADGVEIQNKAESVQAMQEGSMPFRVEFDFTTYGC